MLKLGQVVLANIQFADSFEVKKRPAVVLFEELGNVVVAGVTSNLKMQGLPLTKAEGAIQESIIKLNYLFTISAPMVEKHLFSLSESKKRLVVEGLSNRLRSGLKGGEGALKKDVEWGLKGNA